MFAQGGHIGGPLLGLLEQVEAVRFALGGLTLCAVQNGAQGAIWAGVGDCEAARYCVCCVV